MKSVIEQLQELMVRLEELGKATIATYTQAPGGRHRAVTRPA